MSEIIVAKSASEVLELATDFYGREKAKEFVEGLIVNTQEANKVLEPPVAPISSFSFLFTRINAPFIASANPKHRSVRIVLDEDSVWTDPQRNRQTIFHEVSHQVRDQHRALRGEKGSRSIRSRIIMEGTARCIEETYCGRDVASEYYIDGRFAREAHAILHKQPPKKSTPSYIAKGYEILAGTERFPGRGYAIGHYIIDTAALVSGLSAKELLAVPDRKIIDMVKEYI